MRQVVAWLVAAGTLVLATPAAAQRIVAPMTSLELRGQPEGLRFSVDVGMARLLRLQREPALHREAASIAEQRAVSELLCVAPCRTELAAGVYRLRLGVGRVGGEDANEVFLRPGSHVLVGHFASRGDARTVGTVLIIPALAATLVFSLLTLAGPLFWIAAGISLAALGTSIGLLALHDDASILVDPD